MADRISALRQLAADNDADAILVTHPPDLRWALGFSGSNGLLAVRDDDALFVTDGRYTEQARQQVARVPTAIAASGLAEHVAGSGFLTGVQRAVVSSDHLTVSAFETMTSALGGTEVIPVRQLVAVAIATKTLAEIEGVRQAQLVTADVFDAVLPFLRAGVSERDIAAEIVYQHLKKGAEAMSFEPIVAAGARGALPHARPSEHVLAEGDLVVIDMGGIVDGFCSDMTRTVAIGDPGDDAREAYAVVLEAQMAAVHAARAGMTGSALDRVARDVIEQAGFGDAFSHSLGHGVGYEVHEWPRLSQHVEHVLPVGATVTIEPGVYLPGLFGIRIEDIVALREGGADNLTTPTKELLIL
ncbi:MAG: Xaa-Pro peptidase family protein [Bacteroidota bacterium]